jgi:hypothetical protein
VQPIDALGIYTREALAIHEILDELGVPREHDGEKLSMSQRMKSFHDMAIGLGVACRKFREEVIAWRAKHD